MSATSFDAAAAAALGPNSSPSFVFDIYDDAHGAAGGGAATAGAGSNAPAPSLPSGRCNFVDLTHGSGGAQCGCRRFWSRTNTASTSGSAANSNASAQPFSLDLSQAGWCMCSHHACYHDHAPPTPTQALAPSGVHGVPGGQMGSSFAMGAPSATVSSGTSVLPPGTSGGLFGGLPSSTTRPGQENERPRPNRAPLSPVQDPMAFQVLADQDAHREMLDDLLVNNENSHTGSSLLNMSFGVPGVSYHVDTSLTALIAATADDHAMTGGAPGGPDAQDDRPLPSNSVEVLGAPVSVATSIVGLSADGSIPDTLSWGYGPSPRDGPTTLPHSTFTSQGGLGSVNVSMAQGQPSQQAPSTVSSTSQMRYLRPFAGKGLHTLTHALEPTPENQMAETSAAANPETHDTQEASSRASVVSGAESSLRSGHRDLFQGISSTVKAHETRLEKLENPSFSFIPGHEECQDKHDHADMRVTELESRMDDVEKRLNEKDEASTVAGGSIIMTRRRLLGGDDDATTASVVSMATDGAGDGTTSMGSFSSSQRADMYSQLKALQAQVSALRSASLPSYTSPWILEVVYLPFPLKGIWIEASQFPTTSAVAAATAAQRRQAGGGASGSGDADEWTQLPNTLSRQTPDPQSPYVGKAGAGEAGWPADWSDPSLPTYAPRLLPRACAPGRNIDNRLKSRGLVKTLTVRGADARSLQLAMAAAFGPVLQAVSSSSPSSSSSSWSQHALARKSAHGVPPSDSLQAQFLGLQQPWVPLRKIHKDSRLRFLTRAEMLTPTLWDAAFLTSSVVMKATGIHRLYVTQPDAYLQDRHAYKNGWSWQRLRSLGRVSKKTSPTDPAVSSTSTGSRSSASSANDDALDSCWDWDSRLDDPPVASPSVHHRPSPSPFSREVTPTSATTRRAASRASILDHSRGATPQPVDAAALAHHRSHSSSGAASGSPQQFFTASQSPNHTVPQQPLSSVALRRSQSPFFAASSRPRPSSSSSRRPPPIRTTSMPIPAGHARPLSSAGVARSARRVNSTGQQILSPASTAHPNHRHYANLTYERRSSPLTTASRPSSRIAAMQSPVIQRNNNTTNNNHAPAGAERRRRTTRSPSVFWPRHTPGRSLGRSVSRSMSRSPSVPAGPFSSAWATDGAGQGHAAVGKDDIPFCYATPYSNGPAMDPPAPGPPGSSSSRRRRYGSIASTGNQRAGGYNDPDLLGYGSEDYDDYPMTQDDDNEDDNDDEHDIQVYEDEPDELDAIDTDDAPEIKQESSSSGPLQQRDVLPEDEPWPGIEDDDDDEIAASNEGGRGQQQEDLHMSDSENMDPSSGDSTEDDMVEIEADRIEDDHVDHVDSDHDFSQHSQHSEQSDASSKPSEYPTARWAWEQPQLPAISPRAGGVRDRVPMYGDMVDDDDSGIGFKIHEDGDVALEGQ